MTYCTKLRFERGIVVLIKELQVVSYIMSNGIKINLHLLLGFDQSGRQWRQPWQLHESVSLKKGNGIRRLDGLAVLLGHPSFEWTETDSSTRHVEADIKPGGRVADVQKTRLEHRVSIAARHGNQHKRWTRHETSMQSMRINERNVKDGNAYAECCRWSRKEEERKEGRRWELKEFITAGGSHLPTPSPDRTCQYEHEYRYA